MRHRLGSVARLSAVGVLIVACGGTSIGCGGDICTGGPITAASARAANDSLSFDSGRSDGGDATIEIEATTADGVVHTASGIVDLDAYRTNGLLRAPVCAVANITIVDGEVRNAPPGLLPSVEDRY